jgi:hypothetical protein
MKGITNATKGTADVAQTTAKVEILGATIQTSTDSQIGLMSAADHKRIGTCETNIAAKQSKVLSATSVSVSNWTTGNAKGDFTYRASVPLTGCTASMIPSITFNVTEAVSGDYCPVCEAYAGGVYIWSKKNAAITVPLVSAIPQ